MILKTNSFSRTIIFSSISCKSKLSFDLTYSWNWKISNPRSSWNTSFTWSKHYKFNKDQFWIFAI